jgi:hypothetical protein
VLRFAVHRPGNPDASPRSHGMPCRDVYGRVHISINGKTTSPAAEDGLALARSSVHGPAGAASLRRVRGVYSFGPAWSLVLEPPHQETPARGEDLPVEAGLLAHVPAGQLDGPFGGADHVADVEIFYADDGKTPGEVRADLLTPIPSGIGLMGCEPGSSELCPGASARGPLGPGKFALQQPQPSLAAGAQSWGRQQLARGECHAHRHTSIETHNLTCPRVRDALGDNRERDMPTPGPVECYSIRLHAPRHRPRPLEPHPARLGDKDPSGVAVQSADVAWSNRDNPEPLMASSPAPAGPAMGAFEEGLHGLGKVSQSLLLDHLTSSTQPGILVASGSQLPALLQISRRSCTSWTPPRLLLNCQVRHKSCLGAVVTEDLLLTRRRPQSVATHANKLSIGSGTPELLERFDPHLWRPCRGLRVK